MEALSLPLLQKLRRDRGLSYQKAAQFIGKNRSTLWRIERGLLNISVKNLLRLLHGYGASVFDVFVRIPERKADELVIV